MRLIDADAFIEFLKEISKKLEFDKIEFKDSSLTAQAIIDGVIADLDGTSLDGFENAPTIEPERRWIPVTEKLPINGVDVIVSVLDDSGDTPYRFTSVGWCITNGQYWVVDNEMCYGVIAWMPLPEP